MVELKHINPRREEMMTLYEDVKNISTEEYFRGNHFAIDAFDKKYTAYPGESYVNAIKRVCDFIASAEKTEELREYWSRRWFDEIYNDWWHPAGSIMQGAGSGRKVSLMNCFSRDTRFITKKGVKSFKDFQDGDSVEVLTSNGGFHEAIVRSFGKQKLFNITVTRNNITKEFLVTENHVWRTITDNQTIILKETRDLVSGDRLPYTKRKWMMNSKGERQFCPIGFIHGLVFGDGAYLKHNDTCSLELFEDSKEFTHLFQAMGYDVKEFNDGNRIMYLPNYMKQFPDFDSVNSEYVLGFIMGWFAADGTIDENGRAELYHKDSSNLEIIKDVIESLGIYSSQIRLVRNHNPFDDQKNAVLYGLHFIKDSLFESFFAKSTHKENYKKSTEGRRVKQRDNWKVVSVTPTDVSDEVWCVQVPDVENFTLECGVNTHNCTTISMGTIREEEEWDNLESIIKNVGYTVAKAAAYRQGLGIDFSRLRPRKSKVLNSANESTGSVDWMRFIDGIAMFVGQKGRIPAMLFSLSIKHPDIEEFITVKSDYTKIQNANISVQITNDFYRAVEEDAEWELFFEIPEVKKGDRVYIDVHSTTIDSKYDKEKKAYYYNSTHDRPKEIITKMVSAKKILELIAQNMATNAEPGIQNIDIARKYSNSDYVYDPDCEYDSRIISTNAPLVGSTLIPTNKGLFSIEKLYLEGSAKLIADSLVFLPQYLIDWKSSKNKRQNSFETKTFSVDAKFKKFENQQVWEIELSNGKILECNGEHRWLINGEMKKTSDIIIGDKMYSPQEGIAQAYDLSVVQNSSFDDGRLIGYVVGDGFIMKEGKDHKRIVGIVYDENCQEYSELFRKKYKEITGSDLSYERDRGKIKETRSENQQFVDYILSFGFETDKYHIPQRCLTDISFCAGFIRGLFDADAHVPSEKSQNRSITFTTTSSKMAQLVGTLLQNWFGIHYSIKESESRPVKYITVSGEEKESSAKNRFDLSIGNKSSISKFLKYVGFSHPKKQKQLSRLCDLPTSRQVNRMSHSVIRVNVTNRFEDMYCAVVDNVHAFVADGIISSNCSEQYLSRDSLCVLASLNFGRFSTVMAEYEEELSVVGESMNRFLDNVNEMELRGQTYATPFQRMAIEYLRRTGAGYTNIEAWLFRQGLEYGTTEANEAVENFTKIYNYYLYKSSMNLGAEKGNFKLFSREKFIQSPFVNRMMNEFSDLHFETMRNVTCSSIAPTGSLSLMFRDFIMSYGIEKGFGMYFWKRTRIAGYYEYYFCVPNVVREVYEKAGYPIPMEADTIRDTWDGSKGSVIAEFIERHKRDVNVHYTEAVDVNPLDKLDLMSRVMKWIDSSISVTYMLPQKTDWKDVYNFILEAYRREVKSIAAFPDKKMYGIVSQMPFKELAENLISEGVVIHPQNFTEDEQKVLGITEEKIQILEEKKRPKELQADVYSVTARGEKFCIAVGLLNGQPYEVFGGKMNGLDFKFSKKHGKIIKVKKGVYRLEVGDELVVENFQEQFDPEEQFLFRFISQSLRYGVPLEATLSQLQKSDNDITSLPTATSRVLRKYLKEGVSTGDKCPRCGNALIHSDGCAECSCGYSKCM